MKAILKDGTVIEYTFYEITHSFGERPAIVRFYFGEALVFGGPAKLVSKFEYTE